MTDSLLRDERRKYLHTYSARTWRHHAAQCGEECCLNLTCHSFNHLSVLSSPALCPYPLLVHKQEFYLWIPLTLSHSHTSSLLEHTGSVSLQLPKSCLQELFYMAFSFPDLQPS